MTTDNLGAFYSGNITSVNGTQLVLPIAPNTCGAGCVLSSPLSAASSTMGGACPLCRSRRFCQSESKSKRDGSC